MTARCDPAGSHRASPAGVILVLGFMLALLVGACGATGPSGSPSASSPASGAADASGRTGSAGTALEPGATPWPGNIVEAVMILALADVQIQAAGGDLGAAAAYEDLEAMRGAADGLATLVKKLQEQVPRIADYPESAAAAKAYEAAFPAMLAGATALRDAIDAKDAPGIATGSQQLAAGLEQYRLARREIGPLADRAMLMQRILVK
ncbi:MAG TPA: hypothetical protein VES19_02655 [Candidatus Limnocylindrales bacterium]|nr:hypothetical protein [Candidatus Limnocylindrales bacterium]